MHPWEPVFSGFLAVIFTVATVLVLLPALLGIRRVARTRFPNIAIIEWPVSGLLWLAFFVLSFANGYLWFVGSAKAWDSTSVLLLSTAATVTLLGLLTLPPTVARRSILATVLVASGFVVTFTDRDFLTNGVYANQVRFISFGVDGFTSPDGERRVYVFEHGCDADASARDGLPVSVYIDEGSLFARGHEVFRAEHGLNPSGVEAWWTDDRNLVISYPKRDSPLIDVQKASWNGINITYSTYP